MSHKAIKTPEGDNPAQVLAAELARPSRFIDPLTAAPFRVAVYHRLQAHVHKYLR